MMQIEQVIEKIAQNTSGFTPIRSEAEALVARSSAHESIEVARQLLSSPVYQARMLATFVLGMVAARSPEALDLLRGPVSRDPDWRVQEILAQAFDQYCSDTGYRQSLPVIDEWLASANPNVRRAASEGLRIWTSRDYFRDNPEVAVRLLSRLKDDPSEYVRKSAGNALRDISRKHAGLVRRELDTWDLTDKRTGQTYRLAGRFVDAI
jgi:HEAT repeat protein